MQTLTPLQKTLRRSGVLLVAAVLGILGTEPTHAQSIAIVRTGALSFGSFVAGSGGSVSVNAAGMRSKTGGVIPVSQGVPATAGQFNVSGAPSAGYAISLPADGVVTLSDGNGHSMAVNGFLSTPISNPPGSTGTLSGGGIQILSVGATLTVVNAQAPGSYSGFYSVTVNYP